MADVDNIDCKGNSGSIIVLSDDEDEDEEEEEDIVFVEQFNAPIIGKQKDSNEVGKVSDKPAVEIGQNKKEDLDKDDDDIVMVKDIITIYDDNLNNNTIFDKAVNKIDQDDRLCEENRKNVEAEEGNTEGEIFIEPSDKRVYDKHDDTSSQMEFLNLQEQEEKVVMKDKGLEDKKELEKEKMEVMVEEEEKKEKDKNVSKDNEKKLMNEEKVEEDDMDIASALELDCDVIMTCIRPIAEKVTDTNAEEGVEVNCVGHSLSQTSSLSNYRDVDQCPSPQSNDPKIYLIKCRRDKEFEILLELTKKCRLLQADGNERPSIFTAIAKKKRLGFIYIEAHKRADIRKMLNGIKYIKKKKKRFTKIPIQYMKDCLKPIKDEDSNFKGGDWVRVIRGLYKYDLGMVSCVDNEKKLAQVYVVPRINNGCQEQNYDRFYGRPKARIYPAARIQGNGKTLDIIHGFFAHDNNILTESGFLVQIFQFSSLKKEGVIPNKDELHQFRRLKALPTTTLISVGDKVMMMNGDYKDLTGEVMDVKMPFATVLPHSSALPEPMDFNIIDMVKFFCEDDYVEVMYGRFMGEKGYVIKIEEELVHVLIDFYEFIVLVRAQNLRLCIKISEETTKNFEKGDFVEMLGSPLVGIVIEVEDDIIHLLIEVNQYVSCHTSKLKKLKYLKDGKTIDAFGNIIMKTDIVLTIGGVYKGQIGKVLFVVNESVFINSNMYKQTNGFIVCNSLDVKLIGGKKCGRCSFFDYITIDQIGVIEDHLIICNYHQNSKNYEKVFMWQQLLGMNVKIIKGDQRGSTGVITNIMNDTLQILLDYTSMLFCTTKENVKFIRRNKTVADLVQSDYKQTGTPTSDSEPLEPNLCDSSLLPNPFYDFNKNLCKKLYNWYERNYPNEAEWLQNSYKFPEYEHSECESSEYQHPLINPISSSQANAMPSFLNYTKEKFTSESFASANNAAGSLDKPNLMPLDLENISEPSELGSPVPMEIDKDDSSIGDQNDLEFPSESSNILHAPVVQPSQPLMCVPCSPPLLPPQTQMYLQPQTYPQQQINPPFPGHSYPDSLSQSVLQPKNNQSYPCHYLAAVSTAPPQSVLQLNLPLPVDPSPSIPPPPQSVLQLNPFSVEPLASIPLPLQSVQQLNPPLPVDPFPPPPSTPPTLMAEPGLSDYHQENQQRNLPSRGPKTPEGSPTFLENHNELYSPSSPLHSASATQDSPYNPITSSSVSIYSSLLSLENSPTSPPSSAPQSLGYSSISIFNHPLQENDNYFQDVYKQSAERRARISIERGVRLINNLAHHLIVAVTFPHRAAGRLGVIQDYEFPWCLVNLSDQLEVIHVVDLTFIPPKAGDAGIFLDGPQKDVEAELLKTNIPSLTLARINGIYCVCQSDQFGCHVKNLSSLV